MTNRRLANFFVSIALATAVAANALAHDFTIYRALSGDVRRGCVTGPKTAPSEFRIDPDGMSTFQAGVPLAAAKPFRLAFRVQNAPNDPPLDGDRGTVAGVNGFVYTATYTPNHGGPGHWSLQNPDRTATQMKGDFSAYARAGGNIDRNPNYDGNPPYCDGRPRFEKE